MNKIAMLCKPFALHVASIACAIHCVITPLLPLLTPLCTGCNKNLWIEFSLLGFSLLLGSWIIYTGFCKHKKAHAAYFYMMGVSVWFFHRVLESLQVNLIDSSYYIFLGTGLVVVSYLLNHRYLRCCNAVLCKNKC